MGLFANPVGAIGDWASNAGSDLSGGVSDIGSGLSNLLGMGGAQQVNPVQQLQDFYSMGANTPTSPQDWYAQAGSSPGMSAPAASSTFGQRLNALGAALAPSTPASPMSMPGSGAGLSALAQAQQQASASASGASSAASGAQSALGSGVTATAPRFATSSAAARPAGLQFGAGFGAPLP